MPKNDNPLSNSCGLPNTKTKFVFCNFNKHLKFDPALFIQWLSILQSVDDSLLCLRDNPIDSRDYIKDFVKDYDEKLLKRIGYLSNINYVYANQVCAYG